ncbi:MAG: hypothetical protein AAF978_04960 [Cyanobacteria bacterium P01_E01_bin.48]
MRPTFPSLAVLTVVSLALLVPFFLSDWYLPLLREANFELHQILRRGLYKQITGFVCLAFFAVEMFLTVRKRGRKWHVKLPGSVLFWRSLHIFLGVGFIGMTAVHTMGSLGSTFNRVFLIVFIALALIAMFGVALETRLAGVKARKIALVPAVDALTFPKGQLIRNLRSIWLGLHIVLVSAFAAMLSVHIFLAFFYQ